MWCALHGTPRLGKGKKGKGKKERTAHNRPVYAAPLRGSGSVRLGQSALGLVPTPHCARFWAPANQKAG